MIQPITRAARALIREPIIVASVALLALLAVLGVLYVGQG